MERENFKSRLGFLLVSAGCAIGIGNVWKFPYVTGVYGGGIFVLFYLLFSSYFLFGNMIFKKRKTGKTLAWLLLIHFVVTLLVQIPVLWRGIENFFEKYADTWTSYWVFNAIMLVIAIAFYCLTYRRIKNQKY